MQQSTNTLLLLKLILSEKLRISTRSIANESNLEQLVQGNSAVQNEIMGILLTELKIKDSDSETLVEKSLQEISNNYPRKILGKWAEKRRMQLIQKQLTCKINEVEKLLISNDDSTKSNLWFHLLNEITEGPKMNKSQTMEFINKIGATHNLIQQEDVKNEISVAGVGLSQEEKDKLDKVFAGQYTALKEYFGEKLISESNNDELIQRISLLEKELGQDFLNGIEPIASPKLIRIYDSWWNWHRCDQPITSYKIKNPPLGPVTENGNFKLSPRNNCPTYNDFFSTKVKLSVDTLNASFRQKNDIYTKKFQQVVNKLATQDVKFTGKTTLITGAGKGSIGRNIAGAFLQGGATVYVTTSRANASSYEDWQQFYQSNCGVKSKLVVIPANLCSKLDIYSVVDYVLQESKLDYLFPFAAFSQLGKIYQIESKQERAFRLMSTNVTRLVGKIAEYNQKNPGNYTRCILPFSPNVGVFGNDGMYGESKISMLAIMNKLKAEGFTPNTSAICAEIGWTRSALMADHNLVAQGIEEHGVTTFDTKEMALLCIASGLLIEGEDVNLITDLTSGFGSINNFGQLLQELRTDVLKKRIKKDTQEPSIGFNFSSEFPPLDLSTMIYKRLPLHLAKTPVLVGFGETSPWGNQITRWEMEKNAELSVEGTLHLAWIMGKVAYSQKNKAWIDLETDEEITPNEVIPRYYEYVTTHAGIRMVTPEDMTDNFDPNSKTHFVTVYTEQKLGPLQMTTEEIEEFVKFHGEKVIISSDGVYLDKNAEIRVPKCVHHRFSVGACIPRGWDAVRFGVPENIVRQADPVTLFALVSVAESLVSAGVTDPFEFYKYIHLKDLGNVIGAGMGGQLNTNGAFFRRKMEQDVQSDCLQEILINVMPAWINMLILGACGPIKTPVQACATAGVSIEMGCDLIHTSKAKVVFVGGSEDVSEMGLTEFGNMGALCNADEQFEQGRAPHELSRPTTSTRGGFIEGAGAGTQIMMTAELALQMGVPIYAIVAHTHTACDKINRSVPAPGRGILTSIARKENGNSEVRKLLDPEYRKKALSQSLTFNMGLPEDVIKDYWCRTYYHSVDEISNLEGAMSVWDLKEISVCSFHGTSTKGNDFNESYVCHNVLEHLNNEKPRPVVAQKHLTGHSKGAAAGFMVNGALQMLTDQWVPGNHRADNIDHEMKQFSHLYYPNSGKAMKVDSVILHSFGFGQAGVEILLVHPRFLLQSIEKDTLEKYKKKRDSREFACYRKRQDILHNLDNLVPIKDEPPFQDLEDAYRNPDKRLNGGIKNKNFTTSVITDKAQGVGVDIQQISSLGLDEPSFINRNFTQKEQDYCNNKKNPKQHYAGKWAAKEAVLKAISSYKNNNVIKTAWDSLLKIEILNQENGLPVVYLDDSIQLDKSIKVSISHDGDYAVSYVAIN